MKTFAVIAGLAACLTPALALDCNQFANQKATKSEALAALNRLYEKSGTITLPEGSGCQQVACAQNAASYRTGAIYACEGSSDGDGSVVSYTDIAGRASNIIGKCSRSGGLNDPDTTYGNDQQTGPNGFYVDVRDSGNRCLV